jgi:putative membrane protein
MMAWVRTATSMITFGFSVYKFFALKVEQAAPSSALFGPREFALLLVGLGLFCLVAATIEYRSSMKLLRAQFPDVTASRLTSFVAIFLSLLGLLALLAVILGK